MDILKFFALRVTPPAHPGPALAPKWPKMAPSWHQIGFKNRPKMGYPIGLGMVPTWRQTTSKLEPRWGQNTPTQTPKPPKMNARTWHPIAPCDGVSPSLAEKNRFKKATQQKKRGLSFPRPCWAEKAANMAPSWHPKSIKNRGKIDANIGQKFDASWEDCREFWEPEWSHVGTQII